MLNPVARFADEVSFHVVPCAIVHSARERSGICYEVVCAFRPAREHFGGEPAIERAEKGSMDADLGGGLIKQRVARPGKGRSGGYRTIIAFRAGERAVFLVGFAKNERENIADHELLVARRLGAKWLAADAGKISKAVEDGEIEEVSE